MPTALQFLQLNAVGRKPFAVRMCLSELFLDFTIVVDATFLCVDEQDLSWLQTSLAHHIAWLKVHHAQQRAVRHVHGCINGHHQQVLWVVGIAETVADGRDERKHQQQEQCRQRADDAHRSGEHRVGFLLFVIGKTE